jgi:hypothetical protein
VKKLQRVLKTYNENGECTTRDPFYIEESDSYYNVILQLINVLKKYNFEIPVNDLKIIIGNGINPYEVYVTLGKE